MIARLLPVSIVETPSIMTLLLPPPVDERSPIRLVPVTPGASAANAVKLRLAIGRLVTESVSIEKERSPELAWISGDSRLDVDDFTRARPLRAPPFPGSRADRGSRSGPTASWS